MGMWDIYNNRIYANGISKRERNVNHLKDIITRMAVDNPSYKNVKVNGVETQLVINTGTKSYYKEFQSLPYQSIIAGDYVEWSNRTWLVYEADSDDELYIDGKMYECNYQLHWQDDSGKIISKWAYIQNASSYNNGEEEGKVITLASNQFMVWMPLDEDTIILENGKQMFIDNNMDNPSCYNLTRPDTVSMKFGDKGCTYYIFTQSENNTHSSKLVTLDNGNKVWIADYKDPTSPLPPTPSKPDETTDLRCVIAGNTNLKNGYHRTYTVTFTDKDGNSVDWQNVNYQWNVQSDFDVKQTISDNKIAISVNDENLIGGSFLLQIIIRETVLSEIKVNIIE